MGKTITPKYRLEMKCQGLHCTPSAWKGRVSEQALEKYIFDYADSLKLKGVNQHISLDLGFIPFPAYAQIVRQKDNQIVATWKAGLFQVF
jgi:hypothetical protein